MKQEEWILMFQLNFNVLSEFLRVSATDPGRQQRVLGISLPRFPYLIVNGGSYRAKSSETIIKSSWSAKFNRDPQIFVKLEKSVLNLVKANNIFIGQLKKINLSDLTNFHLIKYLNTFSERYCDTWVHSWIRPDLYLETTLSQELKPDILEKLSSPAKLGKLYYSSEPVSLSRLAQEIKKRRTSLTQLPLDLSKQLDKHIIMYSWLKGPSLVKDETFTREDYLKRIENLLVGELSSKKFTSTSASRQILKKMHFSDRTLLLIRALQSAIFLRTYNNENSDRFFYFGRQKLINTAADRLNISHDDICWLNVSEIKQLLKGEKIDFKRIIDERSQGYAFIISDKNIRSIFGPQARALIPSSKSVKKDSQITVIRGSIASSGKARGIARIVQGQTDVNKVKQGEILVTTMTRPEYIMAMEKAVAFVTDEGGITCHAAIVAREFGVPCITGTKTATKYISDGDLIEVDADKGIVTILKIEN